MSAKVFHVREVSLAFSSSLPIVLTLKFTSPPMEPLKENFIKIIYIVFVSKFLLVRSMKERHTSVARHSKSISFCGR